MTTPYRHPIPDLRLGEFDLGGVLYHANYYHLYEAAREALLASEGCPYSALVAEGNHLAVAEASQKFLLPIYYGEPLAVSLRFDEPGRSSVTAHYEIFAARDGKDILVHTGSTRLAFIANVNGKFQPSRMPEKLVTIFRKFG